jgi:hypothetical protein
MERIRSRIVTGLAALALAGGALAAAGPAASAATPACGASCVTLLSQAFGTSNVMAVYSPRFAMPGKGQSVVLSAAGNFSSEDWHAVLIGQVSDLYALGIVAATVDHAWPSNEVFEFQYTPSGKYSSSCLGASATAANGTAVILQPCGINALTLWIPLTSDESGNFFPMVNGSDTAVRAPYVLTTGPVGTSLVTAALSTATGSVNPAQMWQSIFGPL